MITRCLPAAALALLLVWSSPAWAESGKKPAKEDSSFGALKAVDAAEARKQAETWLKSVKADDATLAKFKTVWDADRPLIDKISQTLALGDADAAKLLADAKDDSAPA